MRFVYTLAQSAYVLECPGYVRAYTQESSLPYIPNAYSSLRVLPHPASPLKPVLILQLTLFSPCPSLLTLQP